MIGVGVVAAQLYACLLQYIRRGFQGSAEYARPAAPPIPARSAAHSAIGIEFLACVTGLKMRK